MNKEKPIKLIIFDFSGVVSKGGYPYTMKVLGKRFGHDPKKLQKVFYEKYFNQAALNKISIKDAWGKPLKQFGIPLSWKEAVKIHLTIQKLNQPLLSLVKKLRKNYKVIILSKNVKEYWRFYLKHFKLKKLFADCVNTQDYLLPKASKKTIIFIVKRYKVKPEEIIYIDDQKKNLKAPKKLGVKTIFYQNITQLKKDLTYAINQN